jgi:hypothetical protein
MARVRAPVIGRGRRWFGASVAGCLLLGCGASEKEAQPAGSVVPFNPSMAGAGNAGAGGSTSAPFGDGGSDVTNAPSGSGPAPLLAAGRYLFRAGELELEVDPSIGGRVTRFSLGAVNILTGPEVVAAGEGSLPNMYGSTFWTSPQSDWSWPPEPALDSAPHRASVDGAVLTLSSDPGATTGYSVQKRFWSDAERGLVTLEYTLQNQSATRAAAPWEISRVPKEGLVFFPSTSAPLAQSSLSAQSIAGISWVEVAAAPATDSKLFQDGSEGWLAYVYRQHAFIKLFEDIAPADQATGEAEIEIFINGSYDYVEIEQQGRYALPPVGGSSTWRVDWILRRLPAEIIASAGDAALVRWVRAEVASARSR